MLSIEVPRKCMLLERVGGIFDAIPMLEPVERVMAVARGVVDASRSNPNIKEMVKESGYMEELKTAAKACASGDMKLPVALRSDLDPNMREGSRGV